MKEGTIDERTRKIIESVNINSTDIKILALCFSQSYSISEIQRIIGIAYKNLSPHIKKLEENKLLIIEDQGLGKKKSVRTNVLDLGVNYFIFGLMCLWTSPKELKRYSKLKEEVSTFFEETAKGNNQNEHNKT